MTPKTLTLLALAFTVAGAGPALAKGRFISSEGQWQWNAKKSHYGAPAYAKDQTMSVTHDDGKTITLSQSVELATGQKFDWSYDGAYDGVPHPGQWITVAFKRVSPRSYSNDYTMADGTKGHEIEHISANHIIIKGYSIGADTMMHYYVEVWDRVK